MGKQKKGFKNFRKNKTLQHKHIQRKRLESQEKIKENVKNEKLKNEEFSDDEEQREQQDYLQYDKKKSGKKEKITPEEVKRFLEQTPDEDLGPTEEVLKLLEESEDDYDPEEVYEEEDSENEQDEQADDSEQEGSENSEEEQDEFDIEPKDLPEYEDEDDFDLEDKGLTKEDQMEEKLSKMEQEESEEEESEEEEKGTQEKNTITKELIKVWVSKIQHNNDLSATKKLLVAFFKAAHHYDGNKTSEKEKDILQRMPYKITSHSIYLRIILAASKFPIIAYNHLMKRKTEDMLPNAKSSNWKKILPSVKTYTKTMIHLLETLKDEETLSYVLNYVYEAIPYFGHFERESRKLLKAMINNLGNSKEVIRVRSFLCIYRMGTMFPYPFLDLCVKGIYFTLIQNGRNYNYSNFEIIDFLMNSFVEICGIDSIVTYQHAFVYIRQLAITLRKSLAKEKEAWALSYNWKFINCLRCWSKVVSTYPKEDLKELIYPLVQIIFGTISVNSNPRFFPLRFKCISMLNEISKKTGMFIPVGNALLDILDRDESYALPKSSASNPLDFHFHLKTKEREKKTKEFQVKLIEETSLLLLEYLAIHSHSIAFPEVAFPIAKYLKKFLKSHKLRPSTVGKFTDLIKKIDENSRFIYEKRSNVEFTPLQISKVHEFLNKDTKTVLKQFLEIEQKKKYQELLDQVAAKRETPNNLDESDDEEEDEKISKKRKIAPEVEIKKSKKKKLDELDEEDLEPVIGEEYSTSEDDEADYKQEDYVVKPDKKKKEKKGKKNEKKSGKKFKDIVEPLDLDDF